MAAVAKNDEHNDTCGETNFYKTTEGKVIFLTQAESYGHRGLAFANYSQLKFECIPQLHDKAASSKNTKNDCRCKPRPSVLLGPIHQLYSSHVGVICMKICTPILAGTPPPQFPRNRLTQDESIIHTWNTDMKYYSKYLIDLCVPWTDESGLLFEKSAKGLCLLLNTWNKKSATFIERHRF